MQLTPRINLPEMTSMDVQPFYYSNADLLLLDSSNTEVAGAKNGKYAWVTAPDHPWDWPEHIWAERLLHYIPQYCKECRSSLPFTGYPKHMSDVSTVFPHVGTLSVAPFQGMTNILLVGQRNVELLLTANLPMCCIEVGIRKEATSTVPMAVGGHMKTWAENLGELLASMYY